ncbi:MAG: hypothetical protein U1F15_16125 [Burkholderiales bacterium]
MSTFANRNIARATLLAGASLFVGLAQAAPLVLSDAGTAGFGSTPGNATGGPELRKNYDTPSPDPVITAAPAASGIATVSSAPPAVLGAQGLNHFDNRTADGGNNFSIEPPDQGLCVGNGFVLEAVNLVVGLRDAATNQRIPGTVTGLNTFFGLPYSINRTTGVRGPFTSDPKCLYDNDTKRFFVTILKATTNPANGAFTGPTAVLIAVSKTSNPLNGFRVFSLDTTNDGSPGTGNNPDCPCLPDQPLIGTDDNGLFITTNEFSTGDGSFGFFNYGFNGAQIYGISKQKLAAAATSGSSTPIPVGYINAGAIPVPPADAAVGGIWYTVQPAVTPPNKPGNDGTSQKMKGIQYFLSALEFSGNPDNRVALWALTNTNSLQTVPDLKIHLDIVTTNTAYVSPPRSTQKPSAATPAPRKIDGGDDRMQQVVMVDNTVYGSLTTAVGTGATALSGVAYWGIKPSWPGGALRGSVRTEGMVSVANNFLQRPSIALNHQGRGVIAFSLIGPDYFPSAAYIGFHKQQGAQGPVYVAGAGVAPDIGFSGAGGGRQRWGDYSAGVDEAGNIWVAAEYIPINVFPAPAQLANWGTYVWRVSP